MSDLSPDLQAIIDAERSTGGLDPARRSRARNALLAQVGAVAVVTGASGAAAAAAAGGAAGASIAPTGAAGGALGVVGSAAGTTAVAAGVGLAPKVLVLAVMMGAGGATGVYAARHTTRREARHHVATAPQSVTHGVGSRAARGHASPLVVSALPAPAPSSPPLVAPVPSAAPVEAAAMPTPVPLPLAPLDPAAAPTPLAAPRTVRRGVTAASPTRVRPSSVEAEVDLLARAREALEAHRPARALALLDEHAARFATGALGQERRAVRVMALCSAGRGHEARVEAARFLRESPGSPLAARVRAACAENAD